MNEEIKIEKIDEAYKQVIRKFPEPHGGYDSLPQLWQDLAPIILETIHLTPATAIQCLLNYTGDFHEFCEAFKEDTDLHEYKEYFDAMDFAWCTVLKGNTSQTDKVRIVNVLRDGQDRASKLGLSEVYSHATDKVDN
ncbi:hypothetical protein INT48_008298 [Thamnidium elegans]|uniref:Uncharacterized protein n=1 Tax=Thamnidium elegans TaxID=101142 RepID=A0A8H7SKP2_9FUNG|nr:hypothetical protein INT48_008298 [Thamnidium elegans]